MRLTVEQKIEIVKSIEEQGASVAEICSKYSLNKETVNQLKSLYKIHGIEGICAKRKESSYSREFKLEVVHYIEDTHDSERNVSFKYNVPKCTVRNWNIEYQKHGDKAFSEERRGRKLPNSRPRGTAPKKIDQNTEAFKKIEQLEKRNRYLEMENEFLKKLDALVQERVRRESRK